MKPVKILELSGEDWMKGLAIQSTIGVGGIFQTATNFDPFETMGYLQTSLEPVELDDTTITTEVSSSVVTSGGKVLAMGNRASNGAKFFYEINTSTQAVTDYQAQFLSTQLLMSGLGISTDGSRIVYYSGSNGLMRSNTTTPVLASEVTINSSPTINTQPFLPRFCIGPDKVMYNTTGNSQFSQINSFTGTGGNTTDYKLLEGTLSSLDMCNDGTYLVVLATNNLFQDDTITGDNRVQFWDVLNTSKTSADVEWRIPDRYIIGCVFVEDVVYVFGYSGIWACTSSSSPRLVRPLLPAQLPINGYQITLSGNIIKWVSGTTDDATPRVYAYGSLVGKKIFYSPHIIVGDGTKVGTTLISSGPYLYSGVSTGGSVASIYLLNSGSTRTNSDTTTTNIVLSQPHTFSYAKVTLKSPLASGQAIDFFMQDSNATNITTTNSQTFASVGAKKTFIFEPKNSGTMVTSFEDFYATINPQGGAVVERVTVYGKPATDTSQLV